MEKKTRREVLQAAAYLGAAACVARGAEAPAEMPKVKLGELEVSRLILGSNPFFGFSHKPDDTGRRMKEFYTDERVMAVLDEAAEQGITAVWTPVYDNWIRLWKAYQEKGGKLRVWIAQPDPVPELMKEKITLAAQSGAQVIGIQGEAIDRQVREGHWDTIREWVEHIRSLNLPAGIGSHRPETHLIAEEKGIPVDYYHQCVYQPEKYSPECLEQALATIAKLEKPVVAYKVLAAGRLPAETAIPYVMKRLRPKDGLCIGVFPKDDPGQLAENAGLVRAAA